MTNETVYQSYFFFSVEWILLNPLLLESTSCMITPYYSNTSLVVITSHNTHSVRFLKSYFFACITVLNSIYLNFNERKKQIAVFSSECSSVFQKLPTPFQTHPVILFNFFKPFLDNFSNFLEEIASEAKYSLLFINFEN